MSGWEGESDEYLSAPFVQQGLQDIETGGSMSRTETILYEMNEGGTKEINNSTLSFFGINVVSPSVWPSPLKKLKS